MAEHDWARGPLGPVDRWSQSLRTAVEIVLASPAPMLLAWGDDHRAIYNDGYRLLLGSTHPAALGAPLEETFGESWARLGKLLDDVRRADRPLHGETGLHPVDPPGSRPAVTWSVAPVRDDDRRIRGVLLSVVEATAADLARLLAASEELVRSRDEILGVVSHDLRNPLNSIAIIANLLLQPTLADDRRLKYATTIRTSVDRMSSMIRDLVDLAAIESGRLTIKPEPSDAAVLLRAAVESLRAFAADRRVRIESAAGDLPLRVNADTERLTRALAAVIGHAVEVSPEESEVPVTARSGDGIVSIVVRDFGARPAGEELARLFEAHGGPKSGRKGAGFGLAIARGIVEAHGGDISAEIDDGEGKTIRIRLPELAGATHTDEPRTANGRR